MNNPLPSNGLCAACKQEMFNGGVTFANGGAFHFKCIWETRPQKSPAKKVTRK